MPVAAPTTATITPFGWQAGPEGYVRYGTAPESDLSLWADDLSLAVFAGRGAGKSEAGAIRHLKYVDAWPGSLNIIGAPKFRTMHSATLPSLERVCNRAGLHRGEDYEYLANREEIHWWNGSRSLLLSGEDPDAFRGPDCGSGWLDEGPYCPYLVFQNMQATLRQQGVPHQLWMTGTPLGKDNWAYWTWFPKRALAEGYIEEAPDRGAGTFRSMRAATRDNPHGGEQLYQRLIRIYGENTPLARRELYGEFTVMEGLVYAGWDDSTYMVAKEHWPSRPTRFVAGIDFGFGTFAAILVIGVDDSGRIYFVEEFKRHEFPERLLANVARRLQKKWGIEYFFADSAQPGHISAMRQAGLPVLKADKRGAASNRDYSIGLGLVTWAINTRHRSGTQRLYVEPGLSAFRAEIENYVWDEPSRNREIGERPRKLNDHLLDCARYGLMGLQRLRWIQPALEMRHSEASLSIESGYGGLQIA